MATKERSANSSAAMPADRASALRDRLSRIEGHVRAIKRMVQEDRTYEELLTQVAGARAALQQVALKLLECDAEDCVGQAVAAGEGTLPLSRHKKNLALVLRS